MRWWRLSDDNLGAAVNKLLCPYCAEAEPTTKDHLPPKGIFPTPRPSDLITVPCCAACNNAASIYDERFKVFLSLHIGDAKEDTSRLFHEHTRRTLRHNRKLMRKILGGLNPAYLTNRQGIITGQGYTIRWDSEAHDQVIGRMIRGLYFHHFDAVLPKATPITIHWYRELSDDTFALAQQLHRRTVGDGQFEYAFGRATDNPDSSVWIFQFYQSHWAGGYTGTL